MARRHVFLFALAGLAASVASAAPAPELRASTPIQPAHAPISMQAYLQRVRQPAAEPAVSIVSASAGYVPRTAHDNSPYRFDMMQNGRRMTAEEFGAWMKARGIRVATGKPKAGTAPANTTVAGTIPVCQATTTMTC